MAVGHDPASGLPIFECAYGTQCDRRDGCGPRAPLNALNEICTDSCRDGIRGGVKWLGKALNGICEDGGEYYHHWFEEGYVDTGDVSYHATAGCGYGTDCSDCGVRTADLRERIGVSTKDYTILGTTYFHGTPMPNPTAAVGYNNFPDVGDVDGNILSFTQCMARCHALTTDNCQYAVWTHGLLADTSCEWTDGTVPFGAFSTAEARCFLYATYDPDSTTEMATTGELQCKPGTYRHAVMSDALPSGRRRLQTSLIFVAPPPAPPTPPPPCPPPLLPPPSPPPSPRPPPAP